jgi:hypothetical protein
MQSFLKPDFHRGRKRRGTAAPRSPLLIAATLINETISTGRAVERLSSVPGAARRAAALSFRSTSMFDASRC